MSALCYLFKCICFLSHKKTQTFTKLIVIELLLLLCSSLFLFIIGKPANIVVVFSSVSYKETFPRNKFCNFCPRFSTTI